MTKQTKSVITTEQELDKQIKNTLNVTWDREDQTQHFIVYINGEPIDSKFSTAFDRDKAIARIQKGLDWK